LLLVNLLVESLCTVEGAGPPNHHDDKVDSDQQVVNKELSLCTVEGAGAEEAHDEHFLTRKVDVGLPEKGNSNSHGARPVHLIITTIKWIRTSRLSIKNSVLYSLCTVEGASAEEAHDEDLLLLPVGCGVKGSGFRVQGSGFRVQGSGFRIRGLGFARSARRAPWLAGRSRGSMRGRSAREGGRESE